MTTPRPARSRHFGRHVFVGLLTLAPLWVTWLVFEFILGLLYRWGRPWVGALSRAVRPLSDSLADVLLAQSSQFVLAVLLTLALLYLVGVAATRVVGRELIERMERALARLPMVDTVYSATKRFITSVREPPPGLKRVVLINFPSSEMKAVGFVTRMLTDEASGRPLAAVYVPTSPNPTSGYIEIVPMEHVTATDWTVEEAMRFVVTGGTNAPDAIHFSRSAEPGAARSPTDHD
jgi:uncharacterized membrane protein